MNVPIGRRRIRVAFGAGHRHTHNIEGQRVAYGGANPFEFEFNGTKCNAFAKLLQTRADVFEGTCYTPDNGLGLFPGDYNDAAGSVVTRAQKLGIAPDFFVEFHSEGGGGATGSFVIYPHHGSDTDATVRDCGALIARNLQALTRIGLRNVPGEAMPGVMSEQRTGVGAQGWRLGVFAATAQLAATTTRLIFEGGAHDAIPDINLMKAQGFAERHAVAVADALEDIARDYLGWIAPGVDPLPPAPAAEIAPRGGKWEFLEAGRVRVIPGGIAIGCAEVATCIKGARGYEWAEKSARRSKARISRTEKVSIQAIVINASGRWAVGALDNPWRFPLSVFEFDTAA